MSVIRQFWQESMSIFIQMRGGYLLQWVKINIYDISPSVFSGFSEYATRFTF